MKEYVILTAKHCPSCEALKRYIPEGGKFRYMDVSESLEAARIAKVLGVMAVPTIVVLDKENNKMCILDDKFRPQRCVDSASLDST